MKKVDELKKIGLIGCFNNKNITSSNYKQFLMRNNMRWVLVDDEMVNLDKVRRMWIFLSKDDNYYVMGEFDDRSEISLSGPFEEEDTCADYMVSIGEP